MGDFIATEQTQWNESAANTSFLKKKVGENVKKTITHSSIWQDSTHIQRVLKQSRNTQCLDSHQIRSRNIEMQILLVTMNHDFHPRGLHSFIKTCHRLTFTPCSKLTYLASEMRNIFLVAPAVSWCFGCLVETQHLEKNITFACFC